MCIVKKSICAGIIYVVALLWAGSLVIEKATEFRHAANNRECSAAGYVEETK